MRSHWQIIPSNPLRLDTETQKKPRETPGLFSSSKSMTWYKSIAFRNEYFGPSTDKSRPKPSSIEYFTQSTRGRVKNNAVHNSQLDTLHHVKPFHIIAILCICRHGHPRPVARHHLHPRQHPHRHPPPPARPIPTPAQVTAIAIANGKILAAGTDADVLKLKGPKTQVIDLNGAFAMPGFNDAHTHIGAAGRQKLSVDLVGVHSLAEMQQRIRAYAATAKPGTWLQGGGWDHTLWADQDPPHPHRTSTPSPPAIPPSSAASTATWPSPTPPPSPPPTSPPPPPTPPAPRSTATPPATPPASSAKHPPTPSSSAKFLHPSLEERRQALAVAIADVLSHGVTSVQDNSDWEDFLALEELEHSGKLHLRVAEWLAFDHPVDILKQRRASHPSDDPCLHLTQLKGFMDGSLGSRTAALERPLLRRPRQLRPSPLPQDKLNQMAAERAMAGFQLGFHAIGDRANAMALNAFGVADQVANLPANTTRTRLRTPTSSRSQSPTHPHPPPPSASASNTPRSCSPATSTASKKKASSPPCSPPISSPT